MLSRPEGRGGHCLCLLDVVFFVDCLYMPKVRALTRSPLVGWRSLPLKEERRVVAEQAEVTWAKCAGRRPKMGSKVQRRLQVAVSQHLWKECGGH